MGCGGCASANERCGNGLEKIYPTTAVRYGRMRHIGEFTHPPDMRFTCAANVVVVTDRGIEMGEQVSLTCFGCEQSVSREQMRTYAQASGAEAYRLKSGRILREATEGDLAEWRRIEDAAFDKLQAGRRMAADVDLPMKIVDCEHLFGGERLVFYFMSEQRVDFRELVQRLAREFQTRIEMRQVGARDEARLVADYETCGRECCCKNFLKTLKPISMSMAKLQKTTLDLSKVSGRCGRLKCCLRYEHETYESLDRKLPKLGVRVRTAHGAGRVVDRQILTQLIKIRTDDEKLVSVVAEDILETNVPAPVPGANGNGEPADSGKTGPASKQPAGRSGSLNPASVTRPALAGPPASGKTPPVQEGGLADIPARESAGPGSTRSGAGRSPRHTRGARPPGTQSVPATGPSQENSSGGESEPPQPNQGQSSTIPGPQQRRRARRGRRRRPRGSGPGGKPREK